MILLDTHVLIWFRTGDRRLNPRVKRMVSRAFQQRNAAVSAISFWEIGMRLQKNQLDLEGSLDEWRKSFLDEGLVEIPVTGDIAATAGLLDDMHGDPADRIIVATALGGHRLVTRDERILGWGGPLSPVDAEG